MSPLSELDFAPWLDAFSENIAMGLILVLLYDLVRPGLRFENRTVDGLAIGVLFGIGAIASMNDPIQLAGGLSVDARNVFVLTGSLFGGPIGAALVTAITSAYRFEIGGPIALAGVSTILVSGLIGVLFNRHYGDRTRDLGVLRLVAIGLLNTVLVTGIVRGYVALSGRTGLPLSAELTGLMLFPLGSALLGVTLSMTHYRNWGRTQQRLADIVESMSELAWESDTEGRFTYLSDRFRDIVGFDPAEKIGKTVTAAGARWIDAETERVASAAREARLPYSNLLGQVETRDGTFKTLELNARPVHDEYGRFVGYRGTAQDVTERERMQRELRSSRDMLQIAQDIGNIGSAEIDLVTGVSIWSDELYTMTGLDSAGSGNVAQLLSHTHPDDRAPLRAAREANERGEEAAPLEFRFIRPDGAVRWFLRRGRVERDGGGRPVKLYTTHQDITERRHAEDELRRSREHLARAQAIGRIGSVEIDLATDKAIWSEALFGIYGIAPAAQPSSLEEFLAFVHPDDREPMRANCRESYRGEEVGPIEFRAIRSDGTMRWIHLGHGFLRDPSGDAITLIDTHQDITERRHAEDELRRSRDGLTRAQRIGRIGNSEIDLIGGEHRWSEEYFRLLGLDPDRAMPSGELFLSMVAAEDRGKIRPLQELVALDGPIAPLEFRVRHPDGAERWLRRNAEVTRDTARKPVSIVITAQDITETKRTEDELRRGEAHLARAQAAGRVGSMEVDLANNQEYWSDEYCRLLGLEPATAKPTRDVLVDVVVPEDRGKLLTYQQAASFVGPIPPIEFRVRHPNGEVRWLRRNAEVTRDSAGNALSVVFTAQDITERMRMEDELHRKEEHLARVQRIGGIGSTEVDLASQSAIWSDEIYRMLGLEPGTVTPGVDTFAAAVHPDDRALLRDRSLRGRCGEEVKPFEFRVVRNGEVRWFSRHADFVRDDAGRPISLIATMYDITDRMRMEDELRRNHDGLVRAQQMGRIGSGEADLVTGETVWSDEMYAMMGLEPAGGASTERYMSYVHPDDRDPFWAVRRANERGEETGPVEFRFIRPDGDERWFHREVEIERDDQGRAIRLFTTQQDITERRHLEDDLRRSAEHLRHAQRTANIGSAEVDLATGAEIWSDGMREILGVASDSVAPGFTQFLAKVHPDDRPALEKRRGQNARGIETEPFRYRIVRPDGEVRWMRRVIEIICDASGKPSRLIATHQDITESKLVEDELRRSRDANARNLRALRMLSECNELLIHAEDETQLMRDICRTVCEVGNYELAWAGQVADDAVKSIVPVGIFGKDGSAAAENYVKRLCVSWDEANPRGLGPMGRSIRSGQIVVARDTEAAAEYAPWREAAIASGYRSTITIPLNDGARVFAAIGVYAGAIDAFDPEEIELMGELGADLTFGILSLRVRAAREKAERELRAAEDSLRAIMDNTIDGLITVDQKGTVLTFSRPAEKIFGYQPDEVIGRNVSMLMPVPPHGALHDEYMRNYFATGVPKIIGVGREVSGRRKDGGTFPMDLQVEEIPSGPSGRRFVGTVRDITERKQTEAQLMQSQKMEAMGQLTGGVAHDFNNLLGVILGRLELLDEDLAGTSLHHASMRSCIRAVERGATLTKSLLAFARQQSLVPVELDLNAVLGDMEEILKRTLSEAFEFRVIKSTDLWATEADPGQLQNALLNLVLNARDAMPNGGKVTVTMSNERLDDAYAARHRDVKPGDYVALSVTDSGTGMPPDVIARAFEPFYTTKEAGKGSGLGLSMVYGFVRQTGGHVAIYSEVGKGTVVRLYLPRKKRATTVEAKSDAPIVGGHETILVVEDNEDLLVLTRLQLERLGYTVLSAAHAKEGLKVLSSHPETALLLTDVVLPRGVNGPQLAHEAHALLPRLQVVFMSGYNEEHVEIESASVGGPVRLLQKPFHVETLAAQVRLALDSDQQAPKTRKRARKRA